MKTEDTKFTSKFSLIVTLALFLASFYCPIQAQAAPLAREIVFPVIGEVSYYNDFGNPRVGHTHEGNDLMGKKMLPLVSAVNGTVILITPPGIWGYNLTIKDDQGYTYHYIHLNNDTPGTDDGRGGYQYAYAPDIHIGSQVYAGQLIGWMGDSGNAEGTQPHLHFEIRKNGRPFTPYYSLKQAIKLSEPSLYSVLPNKIIVAGNSQLNIATVQPINKSSKLEVVTYAINWPAPKTVAQEKKIPPKPKISFKEPYKITFKF